MRWKCLEFLGELKIKNVESYGFKLVKCLPPTTQEMTDFDNDSQQIIKKRRVQANKQQFSRKT